MKKISLFTIFLFMVSFTLTSCAKCEICTKDSEPEIRLCDDDYSSNTQYGFAIDYYEAIGYDCKASL